MPLGVVVVVPETIGTGISVVMIDPSESVLVTRLSVIASVLKEVNGIVVTEPSVSVLVSSPVIVEMIDDLTDGVGLVV